MRHPNTLNSFLGSVAFVLLSGTAGRAQPPSTIQLPTFQSFSISTSVLVPDRGTMVLGGVDRSAYGSVTNGMPGLSHLPYAGRLFQNRAIGREASSSTASVTAYIHDLAAMDEQVLAAAAASRAGPNGAGPNKAEPVASWGAKAARLTRALESPGSAEPAKQAMLTTNAPSPTTARPVASVVEIRRQAAVDAERREAESQDLIAQGLDAEREGKPQVAKLFYQMAIRRSNSAAKSSAEAHLNRLAASYAPPTPPAVRSR